ncbi:hypothetical protein LUW77_09455 [Streptomyces radiopugnans]|nr:hypothetical protein LUW77_09455 [Streptomyces radiopugnans]
MGHRHHLRLQRPGLSRPPAPSPRLSGSSSRTMGWGYYPDGKLKSRTDDGVPVGLRRGAGRQLRHPQHRLHRHLDEGGRRRPAGLRPRRPHG